MECRGNLRRLGLRKSRPITADHREVGRQCLLCKHPIKIGDEIGRIPQGTEEESTWLVGHWRCIHAVFNRLRDSGNADPGATRRFLESWANAARNNPATSEYPYNSEADFILKHGRAFDWRALPRGVRVGATRRCFDNAVSLALRLPGLYTYAEGYAINGWVSGHPVAHAWCIDREDFVVDTTWDNGTDYFGVPFRCDYVRRITSATNGYGLIDNAVMDFPLLTGAHAVKKAIEGGMGLHSLRRANITWRQGGRQRRAPSKPVRSLATPP